MMHLAQGIFRRWGTELTLCREGKTKGFRGFLQHSGSKSWRNMEKRFSALGTVPAGQYIFIGPAQPVVQEGDLLLFGGKVFELRRVEPVMLYNRLLYHWGLCVLKGEENR